MQTTHDKVMQLILTLKGHKNDHGHHAHNILEKIFMSGGCYSFANMLKTAFPQGEIVLYDSWNYHILFKIEDRLYDINGDVTKDYSPNEYKLLTEREAFHARACSYSHSRGGAFDVETGSITEEEYNKSIKFEISDPIASFIKIFKGHWNLGGNHAHNILEQIYTRGNCYMFAKALNLVFPEGHLVYSHYVCNHLLLKFNDNLYDIRGNVNHLYIQDRDIFTLNPEEECQARTFCYSHKLERPCGVNVGEKRIYRMSEEEFNIKLGINNPQLVTNVSMAV